LDDEDEEEDNNPQKLTHAENSVEMGLAMVTHIK